MRLPPGNEYFSTNLSRLVISLEWFFVEFRQLMWKQILKMIRKLWANVQPKSILIHWYDSHFLSFHKLIKRDLTATMHWNQLKFIFARKFPDIENVCWMYSRENLMFYYSWAFFSFSWGLKIMINWAISVKTSKQLPLIQFIGILLWSHHQYANKRTKKGEQVYWKCSLIDWLLSAYKAQESLIQSSQSICVCNFSIITLFMPLLITP